MINYSVCNICILGWWVGGWCHVGVADLKITTGMTNGVEVTELYQNPKTYWRPNPNPCLPTPKKKRTETVENHEQLERKP